MPMKQRSSDSGSPMRKLRRLSLASSDALYTLSLNWGDQVQDHRPRFVDLDGRCV